MKRYGLLILSAALMICLGVGLAGCSTETYEPTPKTPTVTPPAIGDTGTLRVGVNAANAPFAGQASGKIAGLDVDIAAAIADDLGLELVIVDVGSDVDRALEEGTVDIVMGVDKTDTAIEAWRSDVYIESGVALFASSTNAQVPTKDTTPAPKIAAQTSSISNWKVLNEYGSEALVASSDLKTAFTQMGSGTSVDYVAADAVIGSYAAQISNIDAYIIALLEKPSGYCVGIAKSNTALQNALSLTLDNLVDTGIIGVVESKWLGSAIDLDTTPLTAGALTSDSDSSDTDEGDEEGSENDSEGGSAQTNSGTLTDEDGETDDGIVTDGTGTTNSPPATNNL